MVWDVIPFVLAALFICNPFKNWTRGYKTFFMLNSTEHEILNAHKHKNIKKFGFFQVQFFHSLFSGSKRGGPVVRLCFVNFQCQGVLLIWIRVGQGPTVLAVGVGGCSRFGHFFSLLSFPFPCPLSLGDGPIQTEILSQRAVKPKTTNQPTSGSKSCRVSAGIFFSFATTFAR